MQKQDGLGEWLQERCKREHLSLRQAGARAGLSHATIDDIIKGGPPAPETVRKLAQGFGGDGSIALEDHLLALAGYRTKQPGEPSEALAELLDKVRQLDDRQVEMMTRFVDFLIEIDGRGRNEC